MKSGVDKAFEKLKQLQSENDKLKEEIKYWQRVADGETKECEKYILFYEKREKELQTKYSEAVEVLEGWIARKVISHPMDICDFSDEVRNLLKRHKGEI